MSAIPPCEPLPASSVIQRMQAVIDQHGDLPVFILDMDPDSDGPDEHEWDCLVTHVEFDVMSDEQGPVVRLVAWRNRIAP